MKWRRESTKLECNYINLKEIKLMLMTSRVSLSNFCSKLSLPPNNSEKGVFIPSTYNQLKRPLASGYENRNPDRSGLFGEATCLGNIKRLLGTRLALFSGNSECAPQPPKRPLGHDAAAWFCSQPSSSKAASSAPLQASTSFSSFIHFKTSTFSTLAILYPPLWSMQGSQTRFPPSFAIESTWNKHKSNKNEGKAQG